MLKNKVTLLDGAMGSMLQKTTLAPGEAPELFQMKHPEIIADIHTQYVNAGSEIVYANTFGANSYKLKNSGYGVEEIISTALHIAKEAVGNRARVALDIGPIGEMLEPNGYLSFEDAYACYKEQVVAGVKAGADLIVFETMSDLWEVKAAVLAAKEHSNLPIFVSMSFEKDGRTFTGCSAESFALFASAYQVDALGINCSLGPIDILPIAKKIREYSDLPLLIKANAGLPNPQSGEYELGAEAYGEEVLLFKGLGIHYLGGCCGTTPEYIKTLKKTFPKFDEVKIASKQGSYLCTPTKVLALEEVHVIGERINPTGNKRMKNALLEHDYNEIIQIALEEIEGGADILDVNVGLPGIDEKQAMVELIKELQSVIDVPLQIDSTNPEVLAAALRVYNGIPIVNSINGEKAVMKAILPNIKKYGACVVGLTMDEQGICEDAETRVEIGRRIIEAAAMYGIDKNRVFLDCLTLTVSAQQAGAMQTLRALSLIRDELQVQSVLGVSNISFGLPNRIILNQNFLIMALQAGLRMPIMNPNQVAMMNAVRSYRVLAGIDVDSEDYIRSAVPTQLQSEPKHTKLTIEDAIRKGLKDETRNLCIELLNVKQPLEIIDEDLIPALDKVGTSYEKKELYLPQLINAATAAQMAFKEIKQFLSMRGEASLSKGKIILATVKGDVHDIGKNIVKVVLENYGYQVIDLGKDVPVELIVETAIKENVYLIGLSALMTTTLPAMKDSIQALREASHNCKVMVGGAVVSPTYAQSIGADYYAKDAKASADIAKEVLG